MGILSSWTAEAIQINLPSACWEFVLRILVAGACGALIGLERGIRQKEAGVRTHTIVGFGAALLMIVSKYAFADLIGEAGEFLFGTTGADPTRIASQAITAIGFLGAGVIFRQGNAVKGLTTAAGVWATAAIGLCIGAGLYTIGIATAVLVLAVNICLHRFLVRIESIANTEFTFVMKDTPEMIEKLRLQLDDHKIHVQSMDLKKREDGDLRVIIVARIPKSSAMNDLMVFLGENPDIRQFSAKI